MWAGLPDGCLMIAFYARHVAMVFVVILMGIALVEIVQTSISHEQIEVLEPNLEPILPTYEWTMPEPTPTPEVITWPQPEPTFHALTVDLVGCLNGDGPVVSRETLLRHVAAFDWGTRSPSLVTDVFMAESGGCVNVVSATDDHGICQVHRGDLDRSWVDFDRVVSDVGYAVSVCNKVFWKRINAGMCGLCGWYAGRGWAW